MRKRQSPPADVVEAHDEEDDNELLQRVRQENRLLKLRLLHTLWRYGAYGYGRIAHCLRDKHLDLQDVMIVRETPWEPDCVSIRYIGGPSSATTCKLSFLRSIVMNTDEDMSYTEEQMIERFLFAEKERLDFDAAHRPALLALLGVRAQRATVLGFAMIGEDLRVESRSVAVQGELVLIESSTDAFDDDPDTVVMVLIAAGDSFP